MKKFSFFTDTQLLRRIAENDRSVLGDLYEMNYRMISSTIGKAGGSREDIEDILQESIVVLWQNVNSGSFKLTARLSTYLMGVAKNKWRAVQRKHQRIQESEEFPEMISDTPGPADLANQQDRITLVRKALQRLDPLCRKLLTLFYFEERSMQNIAVLLSMANVNTAKARKYQCKKKLETIIRQAASSGGFI